MKQLHTLEEIKYFENLNALSAELKDLCIDSKKSDLLELAHKYDERVKIELAKYDHYIGKKCFAPPSFLFVSQRFREGTIEGNFYFNFSSESIICDFRYTSGWLDTLALKDLKE